MRNVVAVALLFTLAPLSGCVENLNVLGVRETGVVETFEFLANDHDHLDPAAHAGARHLDLVAYDPLSSDLDGSLTYGELDVVGDLAVVAILQPIGGFVTVDVADPAAPRVLGYYWAGAAYAGDVKLSPDGKTAFLAANGGYAWSEVQNDPKLAPTFARSSGVHVVDVSDPANPVQSGFYPLPTGGVHMLDVHVLDGDLHVFSVVSSGFGLPVPVALPTGNPGLSSRINVARLEIGPSGMFLQHVSDYRMPEAVNLPSGFTGPHDVTVVDDPEIGALLLVAYGRAGAAVVSLADPANPEHLGSWTDHDGEYVHTIMMTYVDGKRALVVTPEAFNGESQNRAWFLDATDVSNLKTVGTWRLPGEHPYDGGYRFSTHNFNVLDGKMYLAHFHAGVWVLDVSTWENLQDPPVLGYYMPRETTNVGTGLGIAAVPLVWDVVPAKGKIMVADVVTGFYVLEAAWDVPDAVAYGTRGA